MGIYIRDRIYFERFEQKLRYRTYCKCAGAPEGGQKLTEYLLSPCSTCFFKLLKTGITTTPIAIVFISDRVTFSIILMAFTDSRWVEVRILNVDRDNRLLRLQFPYDLFVLIFRYPDSRAITSLMRLQSPKCMSILKLMGDSLKLKGDSPI